MNMKEMFKSSISNIFLMINLTFFHTLNHRLSVEASTYNATLGQNSLKNHNFKPLCAILAFYIHMRTKLPAHLKDLGDRFLEKNIVYARCMLYLSSQTYTYKTKCVKKVKSDV